MRRQKARRQTSDGSCWHHTSGRRSDVCVHSYPIVSYVELYVFTYWQRYFPTGYDLTSLYWSSVTGQGVACLSSPRCSPRLPFFPPPSTNKSQSTTGHSFLDARWTPGQDRHKAQGTTVNSRQQSHSPSVGLELVLSILLWHKASTPRSAISIVT